MHEGYSRRLLGTHDEDRTFVGMSTGPRVKPRFPDKEAYILPLIRRGILGKAFAALGLYSKKVEASTS